VTTDVAAITQARMSSTVESARRLPKLSAAEEAALVRAAGDDYYAPPAHAVLCSYAPLVYALAKRYTRDPDLQAELVQEGFIGLWRAIQQASAFDPAMGRFATFAKPFIWRAMVRAPGLQLVRLPDRVRWQLGCVLRASHTGLEKYGRSLRVRRSPRWWQTMLAIVAITKAQAGATGAFAQNATDSPPGSPLSA
jgi:DNA-directed RNA polymerase sigma subunit (sigma70/sigma32)